ncbi:MAG: Dabb family protein [Spirochaetales bacterium]
MIKHIVMFKFKENAHENAQKLKEMALALYGKIPALRSIDIGINEKPSDAAQDLVLTGEFDDFDGLQEYAVHPEHQKVLEFIKAHTSERHVVDYTV